MADAVRRGLELSAVLPAAVVCFLPLKGHLRRSGRSLALWGIPALAAWAAIGGLVCAALEWSGFVWLLPSLLIFGLFLCRTVDLPAWKSVSVLLALCGMYSGVWNLAAAVDALLNPGGPGAGFTMEAAAVLVLLGWALLGLAWHPSSHGARWLLDEMEMPGSWYIFWVLPVIFVFLHLFIHPKDYSTLYTGRMLIIYPAIVLVLMLLLALFYYMFYRIARSLGANLRLMRENQFLQLQAAQYENLQRSMEETRRARHDLRHHLAVLQGCIERQDWETLRRYVAAYVQSVPSETAHAYSRSCAVDAVLHHYAGRAAERQIPMEISVRMEETARLPEPELCVVLGNLLENAIAACSQTGDGPIQVNLRQTGGILTLTVDNPCPLPPLWEGERLRSQKHSGFGLGAESVRMIAERYGGDARFSWKDGTFYASVALNTAGSPDS